MTTITINERKALKKYANPANVRPAGTGRLIVQLPLQDPAPVIDFVNEVLGALFHKPLHDVCAACEIDIRSGVFMFEFFAAKWGLAPISPDCRQWVQIGGYSNGTVEIKTHTRMASRRKPCGGWYYTHITHRDYYGAAKHVASDNPAYQALITEMRHVISQDFIRSLISVLEKHEDPKP